jgi:ribosome-associated protein
MPWPYLVAAPVADTVGVMSDAVESWVRAAAMAADGKGAADVLLLDVSAVLALSSYFVIGSAATDRQVKAITEAVEEGVDAAGGPKPIAIEGGDTWEWALMNYGDFLVHVFRHETREFYSLERLWADAPRLEWAPAGHGSTGGSGEPPAI